MSDDRVQDRLQDRTHDRGHARSRRARILVVGTGDAMREVASLTRRRVGHVIEVPTLFDAVDECKRAPAAEPIVGVIISPSCEHFEARSVADAFERVDPAAPLIVAVTVDEDDLTAECTREGFEDSIRLPVQEAELARILEELGVADASAAQPTASQPAGNHAAPNQVPHPKTVIEEIVERAQERRKHSDEIPVEATPAADAANRASNATQSAQQPARRPLQPFQMPPSIRPAALSVNPGNPSDLDLLRAVNEGHEVLGTALRVLRFNIGSPDVHFATETRPGEESATERERRGLKQIPVVRSDGRPFGTLLSRAIDEAILAHWAAWLGAWLEFAEQHQELRKLAWTDELTGAGNRRAFDRVLADTIQASRRDWRFFGLMLFDIDDFKSYNDRFGHVTGDHVLCEIVELLRACIRRGDHIFRIGGDEFAVLFCDPDGPRRGGTIDRDAATTIANRFQRAVTEMSLTHIGLEGPGTVSVSTGFAAFPWHGLDPSSLYQAADAFCLDSKRAGKNRITFGSGMFDGEPKSP